MDMKTAVSVIKPENECIDCLTRILTYRNIYNKCSYKVSVSSFTVVINVQLDRPYVSRREVARVLMYVSPFHRNTV